MQPLEKPELKIEKTNWLPFTEYGFIKMKDAIFDPDVKPDPVDSISFSQIFLARLISAREA
ncbi:hypothetical protein D0C27_03025 [Alcaligenes faecalis]|nr:hypothetical protein D0C27_03025 [Alcaligenes faecalis]